MPYTYTMTPNNNNASVYPLLMQVMFQAKHAITAIAEDYGMSIMQANTLLMMQPDVPLAMNKLSGHFMCDASNVTGIVDRLEKPGLIIRQDHPTDRRVKMILLTAKGNDVRADIIARIIATEAERMDPVLTADEKSDLFGILTKLI